MSINIFLIVLINELCLIFLYFIMIFVVLSIWSPPFDFKYFVTLFDYFRYKVSFIFQMIFNEIKNQFGISVHVFHRDNSYLSNQFQQLVTSNDTLHQTLCSYTQQNEVLEC